MAGMAMILQAASPPKVAPEFRFLEWELALIESNRPVSWTGERRMDSSDEDDEADIVLRADLAIKSRAIIEGPFSVEISDVTVTPDRQLGFAKAIASGPRLEQADIYCAPRGTSGLERRDGAKPPKSRGMLCLLDTNRDSRFDHAFYDGAAWASPILTPIPAVTYSEGPPVRLGPVAEIAYWGPMVFGSPSFVFRLLRDKKEVGVNRIVFRDEPSSKSRSLIIPIKESLGFPQVIRFGTATFTVNRFGEKKSIVFVEQGQNFSGDLIRFIMNAPTIITIPVGG